MTLLLSLSFSAEPDWQTTLEEAVPGVVAINITQTRAFDTVGAKTSQATRKEVCAISKWQPGAVSLSWRARLCDNDGLPS